MSYKRKYKTEEQLLKSIDRYRARSEKLLQQAAEQDMLGNLARQHGLMTQPEIQAFRDEAARLRKKRFHIINTKLPQLGDALSRLITPLIPCCNHMDKSVTA